MPMFSWNSLKEVMCPLWLISLSGSVRHHFQIAKDAWKIENEKTKIERQRHELAFLPASIEIMETPAHPLGRAVALTIVAFFCMAVAWAIIGSIDIVATATGKIIPTERTKTVQPLESGIVRAIHIQDGQSVKKGDLLIELDATDTQADFKRLGKEFANSSLNVSRLKALLADDPLKAFRPPENISEYMIDIHKTHLVSQWQKQQAEISTIEAEIAQRAAELTTIRVDINRLNNIIPKVRQRVDARRSLVKKGIASKTEFLELEQELVEYEGQLAVQRAKINETSAALSAAESRLISTKAEFRRIVLTELVEQEQQVSAIEQELIKVTEKARNKRLRAPVSGKVQELSIHTVGGVVTPAQELLSIVPESSELEIEVRILNKDIGFVHENQDVEIKVDSFPFTKYGTIEGGVLSLSRDSIEDEQQGLVYPARVSMARTEIQSGDKMIDLTPGMSVTVEIKTGKRRLIEYLLAPLQEYQSESLQER